MIKRLILAILIVIGKILLVLSFICISAITIENIPNLMNKIDLFIKNIFPWIFCFMIILGLFLSIKEEYDKLGGRR